MKLTLRANAKLNLMLDILSTLPNGYHELYMIMQSINLADEITLETTTETGIALTCSDAALPTDEKNLAYKAAQAFFAHFEIENPGLTIHIEKHIPKAAGLAGGSADAAAVLCGLCKLFQCAPSVQELTAVAAALGSDVPFCCQGGLMLAQYTGTVISALPAVDLGNFVVVKPPREVSTAKAYAAFNTAERVRHTDTRGMLHAIMENDRKGIYRRVNNVFEQFIDVPERVEIKAIMREHGAQCTCMSGSGPSVFGVFEKSEDAIAAAQALRKQFADVFVCNAAKQGIESI